MLSGNRVKAALLQCSIFLDLWSDLYLVLYLKACGCCLACANMWEFPKIGGTLFWGPYNKGPTIQATLFGSPIFGNFHVGAVASGKVSRGSGCASGITIEYDAVHVYGRTYPKQNPKLQRLYPSSPKPGTLNSLNPLDPPTTL